MATLADSLVSSSARRLGVRKRPDLSARKQVYQGRTYWVVKEPIGLNYFRFQEEEYAILNMLDSASSLDEIKEQFEREFPPQKITVEELGQFVGSLHRSGLVVADVPGQGRQLLKRREERRWKEFLGSLSNVLAIRFKGIDPERLLTRMLPYFRWLFHPVAVACCVTLALSALLLVLAQFQTFQSKLPDFHDFFHYKNWIWMFVVLGVTKVIHEFGHGLSCKYFGGECHEMGVMLLVLTPCLYCNVSDSWMLPSKWRRAAIGAAGMYIEVVIASIATFIWWFSEPGLLNQMCLSVMFVSSVSTIMFNANPLLRYDGYYILSDIAEIPNLRQKATSILSRKLSWLCLGIEQPDDPFLPQRNQAFFAIYSIAAAMYRWVVLFSILWFLNKVFEPYGVQVLGQMIALVSIASLIGQPLYKLYQFLSAPGRLRKVKAVRLYATLAVVGAVIAGAFLIPLPYRVHAPFYVRPDGAAPVWVDQPGVLAEVFVQPGDVVQQGDQLAVLVNHAMDVEIAEHEAKVETLRRKLTSAESMATLPFAEATQASMTIRELEVELASTRESLAMKMKDRDELTLRAPRDGVVFPPEYRPDREQPQRLPRWYGSPLEPRNLGAFLESDDKFCVIGDPTKMEAAVAVDQSEIDFVDQGQKVALQFNHLPMTAYGNLAIKVKLDSAVTEVHPNLSDKAGGGLLSEMDEDGVERPLYPTYEVRVPIEAPDGLITPGIRGDAKIYAEPQTLAYRIYRFFSKTFNFDL